LVIPCPLRSRCLQLRDLRVPRFRGSDVRLLWCGNIVAVYAKDGAIFGDDLKHPRRDAAVHRNLERSESVIAFEGIFAAFAHVCAISVCKGVAATGANPPFRAHFPHMPHFAPVGNMY
jgi:hypothetical protein